MSATRSCASASHCASASQNASRTSTATSSALREHAAHPVLRRLQALVQMNSECQTALGSPSPSVTTASLTRAHDTPPETLSRVRSRSSSSEPAFSDDRSVRSDRQPTSGMVTPVAMRDAHYRQECTISNHSNATSVQSVLSASCGSAATATPQCSTSVHARSQQVHARDAPSARPHASCTRRSHVLATGTPGIAVEPPPPAGVVKQQLRNATMQLLPPCATDAELWWWKDAHTWARLEAEAHAEARVKKASATAEECAVLSCAESHVTRAREAVRRAERAARALRASMRARGVRQKGTSGEPSAGMYACAQDVENALMREGLADALVLEHAMLNTALREAAFAKDIVRNTLCARHALVCAKDALREAARIDADAHTSRQRRRCQKRHLRQGHARSRELRERRARATDCVQPQLPPRTSAALVMPCTQAINS